MKKGRLLPNLRFMLRQRIIYCDRVFSDPVSQQSFMCGDMALRPGTRPDLTCTTGVRVRLGRERYRDGLVSRHGLLCRDRVLWSCVAIVVLCRDSGLVS